MQNRQTIILNTLGDNSADFLVDARGVLRIRGAKAPLDANKCEFSITPSVAEVLGVRQVTFTGPSTVGTLYQLTVLGANALEGNNTPKTLSMTYTSVANDTAATVAVAFRDWINSNVTNLQITATNSSGVLTLTAKTGFPIINATSTTPSSLLAIAAIGSGSTAGVAGVGIGTFLTNDPNYNTIDTFGSFTAGATYTRITINVVEENQLASAANNTTESLNTVYVFINEAATSSGFDNAVVNRALILNPNYGTAGLLVQGYRSVITDGQSSTAAITSGAAITLAAAATATSTGSISGTVMTVTTQTTALVVKGMTITGSGVSANTVVLGQLTGEMGGVGTYAVSVSQTVASTTLTGTAQTALNTATLGLQSGDYLVVNSVTALTASTNPFATITSTKITGVTTLTGGFGTSTTAAAAAIALFKYIAVRNTPRAI